MLSYLVPNRLAVPPPHAAGDDRAPRRRADGLDPSATAFVAKFIFVGMAVFAAITVIVTAPPTVTVPLLVALLGGLGASVLAVNGDEWVASRRARLPVERRSVRLRGRSRHSAARPIGTR